MRGGRVEVTRYEVRVVCGMRRWEAGKVRRWEVGKVRLNDRRGRGGR